MSYSNSSGGTLTLPSPTHGHHVDVTSAVRSLRRSLSRSPSKFRLVTKSPSSSPKSPHSPSPPTRATSIPHFSTSGNPPHTPSPLVPFPPSAKLALRSANRSKTTPGRPTSRTRTSPKSPMKRALSQASDSGNAPSSSSSGSVCGQENSSGTSPAERKSFERSSRIHFMSDMAAPVHHALSRLGGDGASDLPATTSSPLKRSDAIMNLDQASLGSPVAKRRSLHGSATFGTDFNVFDHGPSSTPSFDIHDESSPEYELSTSSLAPENSMPYSSMPRRSSSLRKSTLQQRHGEKTSWGRRHAAQVLAAQQAAQTAPIPTEISTPVHSKNRPRLSLDQFLPPMARDSPFSSQGALPNASVHVVNQPMHQPHPLSRTMTTSSSSSSLVDDSPTHVPPHFGEHPRPKLDFSKSLPAGSLRPFNLEKTVNQDGSFATPKNYKDAKPLPAAFMSTGLVSKVNRNPEQLPVHRGESKVVPDTPCKKNFNYFATYPPPVPGSAIAKARHIRHSFGTPSTPFNPHGTQGAPGTFGKGTGVFGSSFGSRGLTRRGSFLSIDGDESGDSPDAKADSQAINDYELPPTPTKQVLVQQHDSGSPSAHRSYPASMPAIGYGLGKKLTRTSSKLNLLTSQWDQDAEDSDGSMDINDSPTTANPRPFQKSSDSAPSFGRSRALRAPNHHSPTPLISKSLTTPFISPSRPGFAKISHVAPASPLERIDFIEKMSPRTPQDSMLPPDPSGLSISNPRDVHAAKNGTSESKLPPATPTAGRDYFAIIDDRRQSTTPVSIKPVEIDYSLLSRFEKVEFIGNGEFSDVFRVTQRGSAISNAAEAFFARPSASPPQGRTPPTPLHERVFAVKKSKKPYQGVKDRQRQLQEVNVLKALGRSDHVLQLIDHWEEKNHLYIQTDYCEEGSLHDFLSGGDNLGKLDVFRIWKIFLEISQGIKYIHDAGFVHLDLKPANIFITFEGVLKVGDFGVAAPWPVPGTIEVEGDRHYMAPEILLGRCDKPVDIFALGIIMIEIATNATPPENGENWQKLRRGDTSCVPSLTFSSKFVIRNASGQAIGVRESHSTLDTYCSDEEVESDFGSPTLRTRKRNASSGKIFSHDPSNLFGSMRRGELHNPPDFMNDTYHPDAIDATVELMLREMPEDRPTVDQVLQFNGLQWVNRRRRAGATVYEGEWGPADHILAHDSEMIDV